ncbi:hypothetical protein EYF80_010816 [Liparis tanakae]|uniref:Uncharacterized protein n=1 Tax=Liparis tanakae TaxID=230148 RepID=A0A4Z2ILF6_9TELE|nr:hypothetical protein EYF80_010816 [Liparis tanakae]
MPSPCMEVQYLMGEPPPILLYCSWIFGVRRMAMNGPSLLQIRGKIISREHQQLFSIPDTHRASEDLAHIWHQHIDLRHTHTHQGINVSRGIRPQQERDTNYPSTPQIAPSLTREVRTDSVRRLSSGQRCM